MTPHNPKADLHYAGTSIRTIATGLTAEDLDWLIAEAIERDYGVGGELSQADDALQQDLACHQEAPRSRHPPPPHQRTLTAKQFNSHKRTDAKRKEAKKQSKAGGAGGLVEGRGGFIRGGDDGRAALGVGKVDDEEMPAAGPQLGIRKGIGEGEGTSMVPHLGVKRKLSKGRLLPTKGKKTTPPFPQPAKKSLKTACRRRCRQICMDAAKLPGSGHWASHYVRKKVARAASIKRFDHNMLNALKHGVQFGAYRPLVETLDERMTRLSDATREALDEGMEDAVKEFLHQLEYKEGYRQFEWDGVNPVLLVDTEDCVFAALVGQPNHGSWRNWCKRLFNLMREDAAKYQALPPAKTDHHRGAYPSVHTGVTYAPGDPKAHNLRLEPKEERLIKNPEQLELRRHIQKFVETAFSLFTPRLYHHYTSHMQKLRSHPLYQNLDYEDPYGGFFCLSVNSGPKVVTLPHRDVMNLAYGWCAVVALGDFEPLLGGHLILHNLHLFFTFPPGSVVLFPSAFLWHSNVPIRKEDQCASITWYLAGCLFRFIDNSFMKQKDLKKDFPEEYKCRKKEKEEATTSAGGLYSTISEILSPLSPSPPSPAPSPLSSAPSSPLSSAPSLPLSSCLSSPMVSSISL